MFRPCIDLHEGKVKQIVGGTLGGAADQLRTNFISPHDSAWFADLYRHDDLRGGHVIMLGPRNEAAARAALAAWPGGLQIGGGVNADNAKSWIEAGASHVIVTSWLFRDGEFDGERLGALQRAVGRERLVIDLSCRVRDGDYWVVTDRWQKFTSLKLTRETIAQFSKGCDELLIHAVDVEGLCRGVDFGLVEKLASWRTIPTTYAGGANSIRDLQEVTKISNNQIDLTIGSALDIFGGSGVRYDEAVAFNRKLGRNEGRQV